VVRYNLSVFRYSEGERPFIYTLRVFIVTQITPTTSASHFEPMQSPIRRTIILLTRGRLPAPISVRYPRQVFRPARVSYRMTAQTYQCSEYWHQVNHIGVSSLCTLLPLRWLSAAHVAAAGQANWCEGSILSEEQYLWSRVR
jgi:hypothetical protein